MFYFRSWDGFYPCCLEGRCHKRWPSPEIVPIIVQPCKTSLVVENGIAMTSTFRWFNKISSVQQNNFYYKSSLLFGFKPILILLKNQQAELIMIHLRLFEKMQDLKLISIYIYKYRYIYIRIDIYIYRDWFLNSKKLIWILLAPV